jgi:hypothetical protein
VLRQVGRIMLLLDRMRSEEIPRMKESLNLEGSVTAYSRIHCSGITGAVMVDWCGVRSCAGQEITVGRLLRQHVFQFGQFPI